MQKIALSFDFAGALTIFESFNGFKNPYKKPGSAQHWV